MDEQLIISGPIRSWGKPEQWDAPDGPTAQRWADEVNARGGSAEVRCTGPCSGDKPWKWSVRIIRLYPPS